MGYMKKIYTDQQLESNIDEYECYVAEKKEEKGKDAMKTVNIVAIISLSFWVVVFFGCGYFAVCGSRVAAFFAGVGCLAIVVDLICYHFFIRCYKRAGAD